MKAFVKTNIFFSKIGTKLIVPYAISYFLVLLLMGGLLYFNYQTQINSVDALQKNVGEKTANEISFYLADVSKSLTMFSDLISCPDCTHENDEEITRVFFAQNPSITDLSIVDKTGNITYSKSRYDAVEAISDEVINIAHEEVFRKTLEGDTYISPVYISSFSLPFISIGIPVRDENLNISGIIKSEIDLSLLWNAVSKISVGNTGYAYVIDENGQLISYRDIQFVKKKTNIYETDNYSEDIFSTASTRSTYNSFNGNKVIGQWNYVNNELGWKIFVELPTKEITENMTALFVISGISFTIFLISFFAMLVLIYKQLLIPIQSIQKGVQRIHRGDLKQKINLKSDDEIGELAKSFNHMTRGLLEARGLPESILRSMQSSLFVTDTAGNITTVNESALKTLGYQKEEVENKPITNFLDNFVFALNVESGSKIQKMSGDIYLKTHGGDRVPAAISTSILYGTGDDIQGLVIVADDISEIVKLQNERVELLESSQHELEQKVQERTKTLAKREQELHHKNKQLEENNTALITTQDTLQNKLEELERFHKLTIGRELKMVELKKKLAQQQESDHYKMQTKKK